MNSPFEKSTKKNTPIFVRLINAHLKQMAYDVNTKTKSREGLRAYNQICQLLKNYYDTQTRVNVKVKCGKAKTDPLEDSSDDVDYEDTACEDNCGSTMTLCQENKLNTGQYKYICGQYYVSNTRILADKCHCHNLMEEAFLTRREYRKAMFSH